MLFNIEKPVNSPLKDKSKLVGDCNKHRMTPTRAEREVADPWPVKES